MKVGAKRIVVQSYKGRVGDMGRWEWLAILERVDSVGLFERVMVEQQLEW